MKHFTATFCCNHSDQLNDFFDTYLGKQGQLTLQFRTMWGLSEDEKELGKTLSDAKICLTSAYDEKEAMIVEETIKAQLLNDIVDTSIDISPREHGSLSLLLE